mmetsp:Transcript_99031/g.251403  ORF Transcript_99031/g.251403 Transcript_99031/m.251403 type:complete len:374 (-) Transcript_99031:98-1219(-)
MAEKGLSKGAAMEKTAVGVSFWIGGAGLVVLKGIAYAATGSILVRTSMFDSIGDVFSSAIMWVTQMQLNSTRDASSYPVGKHRFAPLGVLFFCAFMFSSMSSMGLEAFQQLIVRQEVEGAAAAEAASGAVRRLFEERPFLRLASGSSMDALVAQYGVAPGAAESEAASGISSTKLLAICVVVKIVLYFYCRAVQKVQTSEILKALAQDHFNDSATTAAVVCTMFLVSKAEQSGVQWPYLSKVDPAVSFLMALWIVYGWIIQALDQVKVLSDCRAEEGPDIDSGRLERAAKSALQGSPLELRGLDVYHAGEGFRVRLDLRPIKDNASDSEERLAGVLNRVREATRTAAGDSEVLAVETLIRQRLDSDKEHNGRV